jgi:hypothetical protein
VNHEGEGGLMDLSRTAWRKSSRSNGTGGNCVEVAMIDAGTTGAQAIPTGAEHKADQERLIVVRDSKNPDGPVLYFTPAEWTAFRLGVLDGEFDDLG